MSAAKNKAQRRPPTRPPSRSQSTQLEVVDPIWLVKALGLSFLAALLCAWLAVCLLFYQGEWQLVLHPSRAIDRTPAAAGLSYEPVRFDTATTGQPQLTAWWLPALNPPSGPQPTLQPTPRYPAYTILYLHDGSGSLSATVPALARLHQAGINIFAIDYRGFGQSDASAHPTEARMAQDTNAALDYLTATRHIPAAGIIPYGVGLGASLAANLALHHPEFPAVVLDNPDPDPTATAVASHPSHLIPVRALFREHFDTATPLAALATPKLLIAGGPNAAGGSSKIPALEALFHRAASPSLIVTLPPTPADTAYQTTLTRFFDEYLPTRN